MLHEVVKHFHHILTISSPYLVKLGTSEMTDIPQNDNKAKLFLR